MNSGIYRIVNTVNGKCYVGQTVNLKRRKQRHFNSLRKNKHENFHLQNAWNKYGEQFFSFEVLEVIEIPKDFIGNTEAYMVKAEQKWIDRYQSSDFNFGYNIRASAGSNVGIKRRPETVAKKIGSNNPNFGKKFSDETRARISASNMGVKRNRFFSVDERKSLGERLRIANIGRVHTQETKNKMSISQSGEKNHNYGKVTPIKVRLEISRTASKYRYIVIASCGDTFIVKNMKNFCEFFSLTLDSMYQVVHEKRVDFKGYRARYMTKGEEVSYEELFGDSLWIKL